MNHKNPWTAAFEWNNKFMDLKTYTRENFFNRITNIKTNLIEINLKFHIIVFTLKQMF